MPLPRACEPAAVPDMNEPPMILPPKPKTRLTLLLLGIGVIALFVFSLTLGGLAWWWLHRSNVVTVSPDGNWSHPAGETVGAGVTELFNGTDLEGWDFDPAVWSVRNGVIYGEQKRSGNARCLFWHDADLADFELRFRFRLVRGNSGICYRATRLANFDAGGYEFEIYTNKTGNLADVGTDRERRRLHRAESTAPPLDSEWHEGVIIANGPRLVHRLDGNVLCDVKDNDPAALRTGAIALNMSSGTIVEFKDLRSIRMRQTR
jgi:hypothetical protein